MCWFSTQGLYLTKAGKSTEMTVSCDSCWADHEDDDPCLAKHMAMAEKSRILLDKLKKQSDAILTAKRLSRSALFTPAEDSSSILEEESRVVNYIDAVDLSSCVLLRQKTFVLLIPCDSCVDVSEYTEAFVESVQNSSVKDAKFIILNGRICVCGQCEQKLTGPLRTMAIILSKKPSVVYSSGRGIAGLLAIEGDDFESYTKAISSFIDKQV